MFEALRSGGEHELRLTCYGVSDAELVTAVNTEIGMGFVPIARVILKFFRHGHALHCPSPLACPFSKPHPRLEPWRFPPNERLGITKLA
jgi:hypothetical protein